MYRSRLGHALLLGAVLTLPSGAFGEPVEETPATPGNAAAESRAGLTERSREQELILQRQLPVSQQRQLQGQQETFLALWLTALTDEPAGTLILVPGYGQHADHPTVIGPLRHKLPGAGWNSLSISLPDAPGIGPRPANSPPDATPTAATDAPAEPEAQAPAAPEAEPEAAIPTGQPVRVPVEQTQMEQEPAPNVETIEATETPDEAQPDQAHVERIFARIDAAIAFAEAEQSGEIVLAGNGSGAYWAARYAAERRPPALQRLALLSLRAPAARTLAQEPMALPDIPTGDFFYRNRSDEQAAARQRLHASQRLKQQNYRQVGLQAVPADPEIQREQLFRRLRGWLSPNTR